MKLDDIISQQAAYYGMTVEQFIEFSSRMAEQQEIEEEQLNTPYSLFSGE